MTSVLNLTVHGIGPIERPLDPGEENTWITVPQFEAVLDAVVGRDDVNITFDDGNVSDIAIGLPRLLARGMSAQFFVLAGALGERGRLGENDVRSLAAAGMGIGSHGWAHRDWRTLSPAEIVEETVDAPRRLSGVVGRPVSRVAVPFGSYDRRVVDMLRTAGAERVYTSDGGWARANAWFQMRSSLRCDLTLSGIDELVRPRPSLRDRLRRDAAVAAKRLRGRPAEPRS